MHAGYLRHHVRRHDEHVANRKSLLISAWSQSVKKMVSESVVLLLERRMNKSQTSPTDKGNRIATQSAGGNGGHNAQQRRLSHTSWSTDRL
jgi:hypothetical protein